MRYPGRSWIGVAVVTIVIGGCSRDDTTPRSPDEPGAPPGAVGAGGAGANVASNEDFVPDVARKHMAIIELSRLALDATTTPVITAFAQNLIADHEEAGTTLKRALADSSVEWPVQLDEEHRATAEELAQQRGGEFDREYLEAMIDAHQNLAAKLESRIDVQSLAEWKTAAAARTRSQAMPEPATALRDVTLRPADAGTESTARINRWAADTYPVAQKHLDTARTLENAEEQS